MKSFIRFLVSRIFIINFFFAITILVGLVYYIYNYLDTYTLHGQTITIPDLKGMRASELPAFLSDKPFRFEIVDSVYNKKQQKGVVIEQNPKAGEKVKMGRMIYLTMNSSSPRMIKMPNLVDMSLRQAITTLQSHGLLIGLLDYEPNLAKNAVINQKTGGIEIKPGTTVEEGSVIDLVLGSGLSEELVLLPTLTGLTRKEATDILKASTLNEGAVLYDDKIVTAADSLYAVVTMQKPSPPSTEFVNMGSQVDLWLSKKQ